MYTSTSPVVTVQCISIFHYSTAHHQWKVARRTRWSIDNEFAESQSDGLQ